MTYVDGCLFAVPKENKAAFIAYGELVAEIFKEHGALSLADNWGEDVPEGETTSFHKAVLREPNEAVVFSWVLWPDKKTRDEGWEKIMADPRMNPPPDMPFDGKRMVFGGFETVLNV